MKRKSIKNSLGYPIPREFDLFGESSITIDELNLWVESITVFTRHSPRFDWYVKNWDVVNKIKVAKKRYHTLDEYFRQDALATSRY